MDSLSSNVILPPHNFASLAGDVLSKLKNSQCDKDRGQQGLPQTLFRRQYGNAWVTVLREPSGKIKGYLEDLKKQKRTLDIKGIPTQLDSNHIENATVLLENSHLF